MNTSLKQSRQAQEAPPPQPKSSSVVAHEQFVHTHKAAMAAQEDLKTLTEKIELQRMNFQNMGSAALTVRDLMEAEIAGQFFATLFPDPLRAKLGIMELLVNAIEHGNLEISSHEKSRLISENKWIEEITRRLHMQKYSRRRVHIYCSRHRKYVEVLIKDEGRGFDWQSHMNAAADKLTQLSGRGITCANFIGFDNLEYIASGYMVKGRQYLAKSSAAISSLNG